MWKYSPTAAAAGEPSLVASDGRSTATRLTATAGLAAVAPVEPAAVGLFLMSDVRNDERSRLERRNRVRLKKFSTMRGLNIVGRDAQIDKAETYRTCTTVDDAAPRLLIRSLPAPTSERSLINRTAEPASRYVRTPPANGRPVS